MTPLSQHWRPYRQGEIPLPGDVVRIGYDDAAFNACVIVKVTRDAAQLQRPYLTGNDATACLIGLETFEVPLTRVLTGFDVAVTGDSGHIHNTIGNRP